MIKILLLILLVFTGLLIYRYFSGLSVMKKGEVYLQSLRNVLSQGAQVLSQPTINLTDPKLGVSDKNLVVLFGDFQCPYCAEVFNNLTSLAAKNPESFLLIWKDLVNPLHPQAKSAALAARCAQNQNKFWDYGAYLFANQQSLGADLYKELAKNLNLLTGEFNQCLDDQLTLPLVDSGYAEGQALKIDATPYLFINGQRISGSIGLGGLSDLLNIGE